MQLFPLCLENQYKKQIVQKRGYLFFTKNIFINYTFFVI
uniref:Uncharacterized protein n=1 Tax=Bartonella schoenbuchensis (strain DSM 13525 / NCTC 13165 / R1) TaxID=687861 RepID=E6YZC7_BARSR|nr:hypothetical protein B11C_40070 [Bartonella schoenbuchensis R1]